MKTIALTDTDEPVRTQITLTAGLKQLVEAAARQRNESLSEYLRRAAALRLVLEQDETVNREELAETIFGSMRLDDHPVWKSKQAIYRWSRNIRKEW